MFCSKCGSADQTPDSYCRQCGEWLSDRSSGRGRFGRSSRENKIRKMRVLQFVSIGMSLASTAVIVAFLSTGRDPEILSLAAVCSFLVTVYQIITLILGYKVLAPPHIPHERPLPIHGKGDRSQSVLRSADTAEFIKPGSVVDNTTELLDPVHVRSRTQRER